MSQLSRDLFIRHYRKTTYAFYIRDETQGWIAREGLTREGCHDRYREAFWSSDPVQDAQECTNGTLGENLPGR